VAGAWGWQPYHLHVLNVMEIWEPKPPGTLWVTPGLLRDPFIFYLSLWTHALLISVLLLTIVEPHRLRYILNICTVINKLLPQIYWASWKPVRVTIKPNMKKCSTANNTILYSYNRKWKSKPEKETALVCLFNYTLCICNFDNFAINMWMFNVHKMFMYRH